MRVTRGRSTPGRLTRWPLWAKPALAIATALALGALLSSIDIPPDHPLSRFVFRGSASDARQLLATVTSTMITVTSLVFVLTVVALQIASTQFSPRLLRSFLRDNGTQLVLSTFVGTVAYSLAGLHTVGTRVDSGDVFVPRLAVSGALALALISVAMLVYYIQHITNGIRIDTIMSDIATVTLQVVRATMPPGERDPAQHEPPPRPPDAETLLAASSGYVRQIVPGDVATLARDEDLTVVFTVMPGFHVVQGRPIGWLAGSGTTAGHRQTAAQALLLEQERKIEFDIGFGLRQLVDIAGRGLSPSLNDPYSAVQAIHHATEVLTEMARRHVEPLRIRDEDGTVRVFATEMDLILHLQMVCGHVRWSMAHRPNVALALLLMLQNVRGETHDPTRIDAIEREIDLVMEEAQRLDWHPAELEQVRQAAARAHGRDRTERASQHHWVEQLRPRERDTGGDATRDRTTAEG
jgi:uncharacterized membrane protein